MFALVDCNNFYCSCERVFNPGLNGKPVVVLSNNDGCVISRSEEAKALGIKMGTPAFMAEEFFEKNKVAVYSSNYTLYGDMSERVMKTLLNYSDNIELYSIDEAFLDLSHHRYQDLSKLAINLSKVVKQCTGIPVTVGIAPTKTLAKMANRYAKKTRRNESYFWAADDKLIHEMLEHTQINDVWGVGPQYAKFLMKHGIKNALQLRDAPQEWIRVNMTVVGQRLLNELKGVSSIAWEGDIPLKKNICTARGFGELITDKHELGEALSSYAANCALKLRKQKSCGATIEVFIETNAFRKEDLQYRRSITMPLPVSTNHSAHLIKNAMKALDIIFRPGFNYHKTGITVSDLIAEDQVQFALYDEIESNKEKMLMKTMDIMNKALGKDLVRFAKQGYGQKWKLRQLKLSPCYTTRMKEILQIPN